MRVEEVLPNVLSEGDTIQVTVSHQMYIDGDQSWVTYRVQGKVEEGEEFHDANRRIMDAVSGGSQAAIKETVRNVREIAAKGDE